MKKERTPVNTAHFCIVTHGKVGVFSSFELLLWVVLQYGNTAVSLLSMRRSKPLSETVVSASGAAT